MNELAIGPGDEASLSMGTLMGDMEGAFAGDFEGKVQKILEKGVSHFRGPLGEPVELLTEYFWRAPDREHLSLWEFC